MTSLRIAYLVHNLHDPAVLRRVRMLQIGGATVEIAGFRRADTPARPLGGVTPIDLGRTRDGGFPQRIAAIGLAGLRRDAVTEMVARADVVIARSLELMLYAVAQIRRSGKRPPLVYECLDIHRFLVSRSPPGIALRAVETALARRAALLITSSPGFVRNYFSQRAALRDLPVLLLENQVLVESDTLAPPPAPTVPQGPPWRIGWFGALRDRKGFDILARLVQRLPGTVEVVMRGMPSEAVFPDGLAAESLPPGIRYLGRYSYPDDLPAIYADVHFTWAIDYFEEGLNSSWLLPNRLYEGGFNQSVPIALDGLETGRMLAGIDTGIILSGDVEENLVALFSGMTAERYAALKARAAAVPRSRFATTPADCRALVARLSEVKARARR